MLGEPLWLEVCPWLVLPLLAVIGVACVQSQIFAWRGRAKIKFITDDLFSCSMDAIIALALVIFKLILICFIWILIDSIAHIYCSWPIWSTKIRSVDNMHLTVEISTTDYVGVSQVAIAASKCYYLLLCWLLLVSILPWGILTPKYLDLVFSSLDRLSEKFNPDTDNARVHTLSLTHKQWLFRSPFFDIQVCYFGKSTQVALVSGTIDFTSPPFSKLRYWWGIKASPSRFFGRLIYYCFHRCTWKKSTTGLTSPSPISKLR